MQLRVKDQAQHKVAKAEQLAYHYLIDVVQPIEHTVEVDVDPEDEKQDNEGPVEQTAWTLVVLGKEHD